MAARAAAGQPGIVVAGAFNIFDTPQYSQPNQFFGDPSFGRITGTRLNSERQIQLAVRYLF